MIRATDIHSVTDFTRNAKTYIRQIRESKSPMALTVNGDAQVVVQDAESFQIMVDELEHRRLMAGTRDIDVNEAVDLVEPLAEVRSDALVEPVFGRLKGLITIHENFDDPLPEFEEYR